MLVCRIAKLSLSNSGKYRPHNNPKDATDEEFIQSYQSHLDTHIWKCKCNRLDFGYVVSTLR